MFYVLRYETVGENEALELPRPELPDPAMAFDAGVRVPNPPDQIVFTMGTDEKGDLGDYVLTGLGGLLISGRFRRALDDVNVDNVQYIPAAIRDEVTGEVHTDYFVANVIGVVDCIDMARSRVTMRAALPDKIRNIDELHLDEGKARDHAIFRLDRRVSLVVVNERVQSALTSAGLTGVSLVEAEGFST